MVQEVLTMKNSDRWYSQFVIDLMFPDPKEKKKWTKLNNMLTLTWMALFPLMKF